MADHEIDYKALAQRTQADFENYKKRVTRELGEAQQRGHMALLRELLPALDNFERAAEVARESAGNAFLGADPSLLSGLEMAHSELKVGLARLGIERFASPGDVFDPHIHEAVLQQPSDAEAGTITAVFASGYRSGDTIIRPATVVVSSGPQDRIRGSGPAQSETSPWDTRGV